MRAASTAPPTFAAARLAAPFVVTALLFAGCSGGDDGDGKGGPPDTVFGGDRPVELRVPPGYDPQTPAPLFVLFHGYGVSASVQAGYWGIAPVLSSAGVLFLAPQGTEDSDGNPFWNATDACCDFYDSGVDDVAYVKELLDDVRAQYNVDPARIYMAGHSNGGYMSFRMACDAAEDVAAIFSLAGATYLDPFACAPSEPVSVLALHGTADDTVFYDGLAGVYPGASASVTTWAGYDACSGTLAPTGSTYDLDTDLTGAETHADAATGCPAGIAAELWTMDGGGHIPSLDPSFAETIWAWLAAHPKP